MSSVKDNIIRISNPEGFGGGFIYCPGPDVSYVYIITARHCLVSEQEVPWKPEEFTIDYAKTYWESYQPDENDIILYGKSNEFEDVGLVIVERSKLPGWIDFTKTFPFGLLRGVEKRAEISGYPKSGLHQLKRTLYELYFLSDADYPEQFQLETRDPITQQYNADNLVEGYSGSPVLISSGAESYPCGLFLGYEDTGKRVLAIKLTLLNRLLSDHDKKLIEEVEVETDKLILDDINSLATNTKRVIKRIRSKIGSIELPRKELCEDLGELIKKNKLIAVFGKAGTGKSAVAKRVIHDLHNEYEIIGLQGEQLDKASLVEVFDQTPFNLKNKFEAILDSPGLQKSKILLIDSIEKLLETSNSDTILDFFELLNSRNDVKLVITCRSYAIENLKIRFLRQFPSFSPFEVPLLTEKELEKVKGKYPQISAMLEKESLRKILEIPFNLDKAVLLQQSELSNLDSESDFKRIMWEYVIENADKETNPEIRKQRGELFSKIAIKRAQEMTAYTTVADADSTIIAKLAADNIIDLEPVVKISYATAHDIYEDWALTRHVEKIFLLYSNGKFPIEDFYTNLGPSSSMRRAFRIWVSEKIQNIDYDLSKAVTETLATVSIANYWKDELLIAILQTPYCETFLQQNKDLLLDNKFEYYKKCLILLNVACQKPDFEYIKLLPPNDRIQLYHKINLIPFGEGWANFINFTFNNLDQLTGQFQLIVSMVLQWKKGIVPNTQLPPEAKNAGKIILKFFDIYKTKKGENLRQGKGASDIDDCILLLFNLSGILKDEIRRFIEAAFKGKKKSKDYRVNNFYDQVLRLVLDGTDSQQVCVHFPDIVLEIAEKDWFYYRPTAEEIEEINKKWPFRSLSGGHNSDREFGINENSRMTYFPPSQFQTPIRNLLYTHPLQALKFIVKLFNHVADYYAESNFGLNNQFIHPNDERETISFKLANGLEVEQLGSYTLWIMYRGTYIAVPNLLKSVLMALESWLLSCGKSLKESKDEKEKQFYTFLFGRAYEILLAESNNVAPTAVLLSVGFAYPEYAQPYIFPLLRVKQIYDWDLWRCVLERKSLSPIGSRRNARLYQKWVYEFNNLPHRKKSLQNLVINYSLGESFQEIFDILDAFYLEETDNKDWRMLIHKMDRRKWKVIGQQDNGFIVETQLDGELKELAEESKRIDEEIQPMRVANNWALRKLHNDEIDDISFAKWNQTYDECRKAENSPNISLHEKQFGVVAGIGLRDYYDQLNDAQRKWCLEYIITIIDYELGERRNSASEFLDFKHSGFEIDAAFDILPLVLVKMDGRSKIEVKIRIWYTLLNFDQEIEREKFIKSLHKYVWPHEPAFMLSCIKGLLEYSKIAHLRGVVAQYRQNQTEVVSASPGTRQTRLGKWFKNLFSKNTQNPISREPVAENRYDSLVRKFDETYEQIYRSVLNETIELNLEAIDLDNRGHNYFVFEVLKLIPPDTSQNELIAYYSKLLNYIFLNIGLEDHSNDDKLHYSLLQLFHNQLANFLLHQSKAKAMQMLQELTAPVFYPQDSDHHYYKKFEFIEQCLDAVIVAEILDETLTENFWRLWETLGSHIMATGVTRLSNKFLLDCMIFSSDNYNWVPLKGRKAFYANFMKSNDDIHATAKLVSAIGFTELMPDAIEWLAEMVKKHWSEEKNTVIYFEKIIIRSFYTSEYRKSIKGSVRLRNAFISILDHLINHCGSSPAYLIREDMIATSK